MIKVVVLGSGNVASHLIRAFSESNETAIVQVFSRHPVSYGNIPVTGDYGALLPADLYLIAVADDAIAEVSRMLPFEGRLVAHTSGSVALRETDGRNRRGVFYPLQSFSKSRNIDFATVPLCLETEHEADYSLLQQVAESISGQVYQVGSEQRRSLHLSAVFVNNFVNHLYHIGEQLCTENGLPFDILRPLIAETAAKITGIPPSEAQTGPARRHDNTTLLKHREQLQSHPLYLLLYSLFTESIQKSE
ncbi:Rossmann-like and DUF2520 domain-containing protein [Sinomicrobium soli]|uniref:Rossmann-like and DUF2520 domain-containing protein n=1 Tax=Sinomicrobium sp. N-1-3-6 TaxID=2219864 RepID=UPI000DCC04FE|nr:DUF2520 domain-containing protein [Sinomicrobium sp. N-1-3-6]RAV28219.1 DUF2520 domain-containing protein [Sinomicrobium sp. N-1-3-6]